MKNVNKKNHIWYHMKENFNNCNGAMPRIGTRSAWGNHITPKNILLNKMDAVVSTNWCKKITLSVV